MIRLLFSAAVRCVACHPSRLNRTITRKVRRQLALSRDVVPFTPRWLRLDHLMPNLFPIGSKGVDYS